MKCKNTECNNETKGKNIYCSLKCRNIYVNKYIRKYDKVKETFKIKREKSEQEYLLNPVKCKNCGNIIPFEKAYDGVCFCSHSCSATLNNKKRKGIKHNLSDEGREVLVNSAYKNFLFNMKDFYLKKKSIYYENPNRCLNCNNILEYELRNRIYCNIECKNEYYVKNKNDFDLYKTLTKFKFNLKDFNDEFNFNLIEKYGWYKAKNNGDNEYGVSRDHMFSVKEGFRRLINPLLLSHPANCELIVNKNNQSKNDKCSINLNELLEKIKNFDDTYGKYYDKEVKIYIELNELKEIYIR